MSKPKNGERKVFELKEHFAQSLIQKGVIIRPEISFWRGIKKLSAEELNIPTDDRRVLSAIEEAIKLGNKYLLPKNYVDRVNSVINKFKAVLNKASFSVENLKGRFVPENLYDRVKQAFEYCKDDFFSLRDEGVENFDRMVDSMREKYSIILDDNPNKEGIMEAIFEKLISKSDFEKSFEFDYKIFLMPDFALPEFAEGLREEYQRARRGQIDDLIKDIVGHVYGMLEASLKEINESVSNKGTIAGGSKRKLKNLIESLDELNFYNDEFLKSQISGIRSQLDDEVFMGLDDSGIQKTLVDLQESASEVVKELNSDSLSKTSRLLDIFK